MSVPLCNWPVGNGHRVSFEVYGNNDNWRPLAGVYIFAFKETADAWRALYVGQTDDFSARLPSHERLQEAVRRGATHIHARIVERQTDRDALEAALIQTLQPVMNDQLR